MSGYSVERVLDAIVAAEGWPHYTEAPGDRGGPTKGGITLATLRGWLNPSATREDLQELELEHARAIYRRRFILDPGFLEISDELLRYQVVDAGVHSGPRRASRWLQQAVGGVTVDGRVGPKSLAAVNDADPHRLGIRFAVLRLRFLGELIERDRSQAKWADGWVTRATSFLDLEAER